MSFLTLTAPNGATAAVDLPAEFLAMLTAGQPTSLPTALPVVDLVDLGTLPTVPASLAPAAPAAPAKVKRTKAEREQAKQANQPAYAHMGDLAKCGDYVAAASLATAHGWHDAAERFLARGRTAKATAASTAVQTWASVATVPTVTADAMADAVVAAQVAPVKRPGRPRCQADRNGRTCGCFLRADGMCTKCQADRVPTASLPVPTGTPAPAPAAAPRAKRGPVSVDFLPAHLTSEGDLVQHWATIAEHTVAQGTGAQVRALFGQALGTCRGNAAALASQGKAVDAAIWAKRAKNLGNVLAQYLPVG